MNTEVRCRSCGSTFFVDDVEAVGTPCPVCGVPLESGGPSAARTPGSAAANAEEREIVCPRCKLHFTLRPDTAASPGAKRTVLVAESDEYFLTVAREALEPRFLVKLARTETEAVGVLEGGGIDLMILDLRLGGEQGAVRLLEDLRRKYCPVILSITADDEAVMYGDLWRRLQVLGADDVVIKGMQAGETLVRKVGESLGEPVDDESPVP